MSTEGIVTLGIGSDPGGTLWFLTLGIGINEIDTSGQPGHVIATTGRYAGVSYATSKNTLAASARILTGRAAVTMTRENTSS